MKYTYFPLTDNRLALIKQALEAFSDNPEETTKLKADPERLAPIIYDSKVHHHLVTLAMSEVLLLYPSNKALDNLERMVGLILQVGIEIGRMVEAEESKNAVN